MANTNDTAVVVFTRETKTDILSQAGTEGWVVNPNSVARCHYVVCCRREDWKNKTEALAHRSAFLVGRIRALERLEGTVNGRGQARFRIGISEYADVSVLNVWRDNVRNPVAYDGLKRLGIVLKRLKFQPVGEPRPVAAGALTIAQAKRGLAATFGVRPDDIDIIIKG